ncbi:hypothetical protein KW797_00110 [Candidatus Parcubacteria bacterium]|nr:hypothetical protein [Candidatus Parcubacteria bacterium]
MSDQDCPEVGRRVSLSWGPSNSQRRVGEVVPCEQPGWMLNASGVIYFIPPDGIPVEWKYIDLVSDVYVPSALLSSFPKVLEELEDSYKLLLERNKEVLGDSEEAKAFHDLADHAHEALKTLKGSLEADAVLFRYREQTLRDFKISLDQREFQLQQRRAEVEKLKEELNKAEVELHKQRNELFELKGDRASLSKKVEELEKQISAQPKEVKLPNSNWSIDEGCRTPGFELYYKGQRAGLYASHSGRFFPTGDVGLPKSIQKFLAAQSAETIGDSPGSDPTSPKLKAKLLTPAEWRISDTEPKAFFGVTGFSVDYRASGVGVGVPKPCHADNLWIPIEILDQLSKRVERVPATLTQPESFIRLTKAGARTLYTLLNSPGTPYSHTALGSDGTPGFVSSLLAFLSKTDGGVHLQLLSQGERLSPLDLLRRTLESFTGGLTWSQEETGVFTARRTTVTVFATFELHNEGVATHPVLKLVFDDKGTLIQGTPQPHPSTVAFARLQSELQERIHEVAQIRHSLDTEAHNHRVTLEDFDAYKKANPRLADLRVIPDKTLLLRILKRAKLGEIVEERNHLTLQTPSGPYIFHFDGAGTLTNLPTFLPASLENLQKDRDKLAVELSTLRASLTQDPNRFTPALEQHIPLVLRARLAERRVELWRDLADRARSLIDHDDVQICGGAMDVLEELDKERVALKDDEYSLDALFESYKRQDAAVTELLTRVFKKAKS